MFVFRITLLSRHSENENILLYTYTHIQGNRKSYKSSRYEYSSSSTTKRDGGNVPPPKSYESVAPTNLNQLDNLLDDLKQERGFSFDKGNCIQFLFNISNCI